MATQSVHKNKQGPVWPLGLIVNVTPGTPVGIMSLVDPASANAPETAAGPGPSTSDEYTVRCQQIIFQAYKSGATKLASNTGNVYVVRQNNAGAGGTGDLGIVIACLTPGQTFVLASAPMSQNVFSPYRYLIDADTANDAAQVTLVIQH